MILDGCVFTDHRTAKTLILKLLTDQTNTIHFVWKNWSYLGNDLKWHLIRDSCNNSDTLKQLDIQFRS